MRMEKHRDAVSRFFFDIERHIPRKILAVVVGVCMLVFAVLMVAALLFVDVLDGGVVSLILSSAVTVGIVYDTMVKYPAALSKHPFISLTVCLTPFVMMIAFFWFAFTKNDGYPGSITLFLWGNAIRTYYMARSYDEPSSPS